MKTKTSIGPNRIQGVASCLHVFTISESLLLSGISLQSTMLKGSPVRNAYNPDIRPNERFWVDQQPFLLSQGYKLRPRYDPAWVPSWKHPGNEGQLAGFCEDGSGLLVNIRSPMLCIALLMVHNALQKGKVIDATPADDGVKVVLKRVPTTGDKIRIILHLSSAEIRSDLRNRTVHIIDIISLPSDKETVPLVMPYLRVFNTPPFHCRGEFVESVRQFLHVCRCYGTRIKHIYSPFVAAS
jgi:hypothetical protein